MRRILIVDCNAKLGGIQKSLISFLKNQSKDNDISVLFLYKSGVLLQSIPSNIKVFTSKSDYRYMGMSQADCKSMHDKIKRALYVAICRIFGQKCAVKIVNRTLKKDTLEYKYDEIISYSHMTDDHSFYGGTPQYVLNITAAGKKTCYIHCDYMHSGNRSVYSDSVYEQFDEIVCVSKSTRKTFLTALPQLKDKVIVRYNYIDGDYIDRSARENSYVYDERFVNFIVVARLTREKGVERLIKIFADLDNIRPCRLYILGDGMQRKQINQLIKEGGMEGSIILLGEQINPYSYMLNADLLIVPSYHEAAPVIYQEAIHLNLPVLTTRTTSADEMIGERYGMVVDNDDEAIKKGILDVLSNPQTLIRRFQ